MTYALVNIFSPAVGRRFKVGAMALVTAACFAACSQAPTSHTTSKVAATVLTTPIPSPSLAPVVIASSTPTNSVFLASPTTRPVLTGQVNWSVRVYLTVMDRFHQRLTVAIVDSRGIQEPGSYNLTLALAATPCCPNNPTPPPGPIITTQHYSSYCCTPVVMPVNLQWGGTWAVTGTVSWGGRTERVSESGPVP